MEKSSAKASRRVAGQCRARGGAPVRAGNQGSFREKILKSRVPLRLISTAGKGKFKTYRNRYQLTFGRKAKKASGKCQGFHQDKLVQEC